MSVSYILPLKAPSPLPATGVDIVTFKVWKNTLVAHIQQDANHHHLMPGGLYSTWRAAEFGQRIQALAATDPDRVATVGQRAQLGKKAYNAELARLLTLRNAQIAACYPHCHFMSSHGK